MSDSPRSSLACHSSFVHSITHSLSLCLSLSLSQSAFSAGFSQLPFFFCVAIISFHSHFIHLIQETLPVQTHTRTHTHTYTNSTEHTINKTSRYLTKNIWHLKHILKYTKTWQMNWREAAIWHAQHSTTQSQYLLFIYLKSGNLSLRQTQ